MYWMSLVMMMMMVEFDDGDDVAVAVDDVRMLLMLVHEHGPTFVELFGDFPLKMFAFVVDRREGQLTQRSELEKWLKELTLTMQMYAIVPLMFDHNNGHHCCVHLNQSTNHCPSFPNVDDDQ